MKKLTQLVLGISAIGAAGIGPAVGVGVFKIVNPDILLLNDTNKEQTLTYNEGKDDRYTTEEKKIGLVFRTYTFANTKEECDNHYIRFRIGNLKWSSDLVELDEGKTEPEIGLCYDEWGTKIDDPNICNGFFGHFAVRDCTLKAGAWITFDINMCVCRRNDSKIDSESYEKVTGWSIHNGFKLTFN